MNKKVSGIIGIILSIILLVYFESFFYKVLGLLNININNFSSIIKTIIDIGIKLVMCFLVYLIYKKDFRRSRSKNNIFKSILMLIVFVVVLTCIMYLNRYVVNYLGDIFNVKVLGSDYYNIFNKTLTFDLVVKIIIDYFIVPYLYCSVIILSTDKFFKRNDTFIVFSGLLASIIHALSLSGTLGFVIINSLNIFLLFAIFAFLYRRENSIWFTIFLYSFYLILSGVVINYLGW